jgi:hypothetical protein
MDEQKQDYQEIPGATQSQERLMELEKESLTIPKEQIDAQRERVMFEKYVQDGGEPIPPNFKTAGDWFDSLKEAQGNYTRGQQEIASLKEQYEEGGVVNPNYDPAIERPQPEVTSEPTKEFTRAEELRLDPAKIEPPAEVTPPKLTEDIWNKWAAELAVSGEMSESTVNEIMDTTGFPKAVVDDFITGQKAKRRESFSKASDIVGSKERLQDIFEWAETTLSLEQQQQINMGLSSPSYEVTLRGLASMYNESSAQAAKNQEPTQVQGLQQVSGSESGFTAYRTKREFTADRNNPRFKLEPQFRQAVEQRMLRTDFNSLPA